MNVCLNVHQGGVKSKDDLFNTMLCDEEYLSIYACVVCTMLRACLFLKRPKHYI